MINKKAIDKTANSIINKDLNVFIYNTLMSRKEYEMNKYLYDILKPRFITELKSSNNFLTFSNQKHGKRVFDYSATLKEIETKRFDVKSFRESNPDLYNKYIINGTSNRVEYAIKKVK